SGFPAAGQYVLRLTATQSGFSASDTVTITACDQPEAPADIMLLMDVSGSIGSSLPQARQAARTFVDLVNMPIDQVGLIPFAGQSYVAQKLTKDKDILKRSINVVQAQDQNTTPIIPPVQLAQ